MKNNITADRSNALYIALSGVFGAAFFLVLFSELLNTKYIDWIFSIRWPDPVQHYLGWNFFRRSEWTFPIGIMTNYIYPSGVSVVFTDSLPWMSIIFKPFHKILPEPFQFVGIFYLLCYILQGIFGYLLSKLALKNKIAALLGSIFFIISPIMIFRIYLYHEALAAHWLILAALWLTLRRRERYSQLGWLAVFIISVGTHPYLFFMAGFIMGLDVIVKQFVDKTVSIKQSLIFIVINVVAVVITAYLLGVLYTDKASAGGFDEMSMNLNSLINPLGYSLILKDLPVVRVQYEGFNYLGLGMLILLAYAVISFILRENKLEALRRNWPLIAFSIVLTFLALSNSVFINTRQLIHYEIKSETIRNLFALIRGSGRMFWTVYYLIILFALSALKNHKKKAVIAVLVGILFIQTADFSRSYKNLGNRFENQNWSNPVASDFWEKSAKLYDTVYFLPEYAWGASYENIALWASNNGLNLNSGFIARPSKNSQKNLEAQREEFKKGIIRDDVLYIFPQDEIAVEYLKGIDLTGHLLAKVDNYNVLAPKFKEKYPNHSYDEMKSVDELQFRMNENKKKQDKKL